MIRASLATMVVSCLLGRASAAGFQIRENSTEGLGSAFAGSGSAADDPAVAYNNPAAMSLLSGTQAAFGGTVILPDATFSGSARNALGLPSGGAADRNGGDTASVPFGYLVQSITPDLRVGLAVTAPFGLSTDYGPDWAGRYQAETTYLRTIDINPSLSYRVTPWLSLGAGFSAQYADADLSSAINSTIVALGATGVLTPLPDGQLTLKGHDWGWGWDLGALLQPSSTTRIGLAYHSRIKHTLDGGAKFNVPFPLSLNPAFANTGASTGITLPDTATVSLSQQITPRWSVMADATWTHWSLFKSLVITSNAGNLIGQTTENWNDSFSVALGASVRATPRLTLRAGTAFDRTPVQDLYRTARVPDQDRYWLSIGASYAVAANLTLDASYAHLFIPQASIDEASPTGDVLAGHYASHIDLIALGARARF